MVQDLSEYISRSLRKQQLLFSIYLAPGHLTYLKYLTKGQSAGTCFGYGQYIKELTKMGVITKTYEGRQVVLSVTPQYQPVVARVYNERPR